jgi:hypothetical protein
MALFGANEPNGYFNERGAFLSERIVMGIRIIICYFN